VRYGNGGGATVACEFHGSAPYFDRVIRLLVIEKLSRRAAPSISEEKARMMLQAHPIAFCYQGRWKPTALT
jgi:hypothetical protein